MGLDRKDQDAYRIDQEGQCVHGGVGEVAAHGDDDGVVSVFVLVVEGPCVGMDDDMLEEGRVVVVQAQLAVEELA